MPSLHKRSSHYYAVFYDPLRRPKQKWVTLRTRNKTVALRKMAELDNEYAASRFDPWHDRVASSNTTLQEVIDRFLERRGKSPKTLLGYSDVLGRFARGLAPDFPMAGVTATHIQAFCYRDDLSPASQQSYYRHLGAFFAWAVEENACEANPMTRVSRRAACKREADFFTPADIAHLTEVMAADASGSWLVDVVRLAVGTGLRRGELVHLRWGDVDLDSGFLVVRNRDDFRTKSGHDRRVPLVGDARAVVARRSKERSGKGKMDRSDYVLTSASGGKINADYLSKRFLFYRRKAGLHDGLHFHSLRHTAASWLVMRGVSLPIVQAILGHSDMAVTQRYAHLAPETLRDEMTRAFGEIAGRQDT